MNIGDPSRSAVKTAPINSTESVRQATHLESLLKAAQGNEIRLATVASFLCDILTKVRGTSVPVDGQPRPERIGGTLGALEDTLCNAADHIHTIEVALHELNATI